MGTRRSRNSVHDWHSYTLLDQIQSCSIKQEKENTGLDLSVVLVKVDGNAVDAVTFVGGIVEAFALEDVT